MWSLSHNRPTKRRLLAGLPLRVEDLCIRALRQGDIDLLAGWPGYPWPYERFDLPFAGLASAGRSEVFEARRADPGRITLVGDLPAQPCAVYLGLVQIDWRAGFVGNMGYRVHSEWCGRGIGTRFMRAVSDLCFEGGMRTLRLDVIAANARAIRCYEKAGFVRTGEFWQEDPHRGRVDLTEDRYDFLRPHVDASGRVPRLRFYWMQRERGGR